MPPPTGRSSLACSWSSRVVRPLGPRGPAGEILTRARAILARASPPTGTDQATVRATATMMVALSLDGRVARRGTRGSHPPWHGGGAVAWP